MCDLIRKPIVNRKTKIILSAVIGLVFPPVLLYTLYLLAFDKAGKPAPDLKDCPQIKHYTGRISEVGPSNVKSWNMLEYTTEFTYLMIDGQELKHISIVNPLRDMFRSAYLNNATLYLYENTIIGIKLDNGRTYSANCEKGSNLLAGSWFLLVCSVPGIALFGLGFLGFYVAYLMRKQGKIYIQAHNIPNAIVLTD